MSSILDAFKKLENDKRIKKPDHFRIDENILQEMTTTRLTRTAVTLIAVALFVCGSGATYIILKHGANDLAKPQTALYSGIESKHQPQISEAGTTPEQKSGAKRTNIPPRLSQKAPPASKTLTHSISPPKITSQISQPEKHEVITTTPLPKPAPKIIVPVNAVTRPALTVNGIAFQDGGRNNMAMINGIAVSSGDMIEGVRVEDIQKNRVSFSQGGEKFDINLNKSNR